ncbi:MAG: hypothetical protein KUG56_07030 [Kordiimonadaceae bacterium]|nr:hypothetical protein [Kordiimonadaceae bacterium]
MRRFFGLPWIAAGIGFFAGMFWAYFTVYGITFELSWPSNETMAAWSGTLAGFAAIGIAIWNNSNTDKRFFRQLSAEQKLDKKADDRQQAEWTRRVTDTEDALSTFQEAAVQGLIAELEAIAKSANVTVLYAEHANSVQEINGLQDRPAFSGVRPVYDTLGSQTTRLPAHILKAISVHEGDFRAKLNILTNPFTGVPRRQPLGAAAEKVRWVCGEYLATLKYDPKTGIKPSEYEVLGDIGITDLT